MIDLLCVTRRAFIILAGLVLAPAASAETLSLSYSYFTIGGSSLSEIEEQMKKHGPQLHGNAFRHPGATQLGFASSVEYRKEKDHCRIASARMSIKANVILPRWKRPRGTDARTRIFWDVFSADIVRHEESHLVIARNYAREFERRVADMPAERNCRILANKAEAIKRSVLAEHDREQRRFDLIEGKSMEKRLVSKFKAHIERKYAKD